MKWWMKVLAVALAAVVVVFPVLAQVSTAQAVPIPEGDVFADDDLTAIEGLARVRRCFFEGGGGGPLWFPIDVRVPIMCPEKQLIPQSVPQTTGFAQWLIQQMGVQATRHSAVRDTMLGMMFGGAGEALRAKLENRSLTLADVGFGMVWGGLSGAGAHWIGRGLEKLAKP